MKREFNYGEPMSEYAAKRNKVREEEGAHVRKAYMKGRTRAFQPSDLGNVAAWFRNGAGIAVTPTNGVSQWSDASGNGRHLVQATDANRPIRQADGSILFDGVSQFLKTANFTLVQPETVYLLIKQITWTSDRYLCNGNAVSAGGLQQITASPQFRPIAGSATTNNSDLALGVYGVVAAVFNGASSLSQVNLNAAVSADVGVGDMGGFTLADRSGAGANAANVQIKEAVIYSAAHDAATRSQVINYLAGIGGLSI